MLKKICFFLGLSATTSTFANVDLNNYLDKLPEGANLAFIAKNINQKNKFF